MTMTANDNLPAVLCAADVPNGVRKQLADAREVLILRDARLEDAVAELDAPQRERAEVLVVRGSTAIGTDVLSALPRLRMVSCIGSGYEGIDLQAARALGVWITHSPGANASCVADLAVGLMIAVVRGIFESNATLHRGEWPGENGTSRPRWRSLTGLKVGIYGLGAIGVQIARRVEALEMLVAYHNRRPRSDTAYPYQTSLLELARWADVLVVAARGSSETRHVVDRQVLRALGADGYVVNIARGTIIDEEALIEALTGGTIAGAALDVFANEPNVSAALVSAPNVIATAHIAGDTDHSEASMARMVLTNVEALFAGRTVPNLVRETLAATDQ